MKKIAIVLWLCATPGCGDGLDDPSAGELTQEFQTGCDPNLPPCACALKGMDICNDPDGDGIVSLYDNCRYTYNPDQANCDGDSLGDACDSVNEIVTTSTTVAPQPPQVSPFSTCVGDAGDRGIYYRQVSHFDLVTTTTTRTKCGPSGSGSETTVETSRFDYPPCWDAGRFPRSCFAAIDAWVSPICFGHAY